MTRLQSYLNANNISSARLERATGIVRQSMSKIRSGSDVRLSTMIRILRGIREASGNPAVTMDEIFDLDPDSAPNGALSSHL